MNCPFIKIEQKEKMFKNDDDFMSALTPQSSSSLRDVSKYNDYSERLLTPSDSLNEMSKYFTSSSIDSGKKSCPCSVGSNQNLENGSTGGIKKGFSNLFDSITNLLNNMAGERDIYKAISLYEFYMNIVLLVLIISTQNTYLALLFVGLFSKQIPERIIKTFLSRKNGELTEIAKRPDGANNCNMFNSGGDASQHSGLISGHTFLISTLAFYLIYKFTDNFKHNPNYKQSIFILILFIWIGLVAMARMRLGCHKPHQTVFGFVMGIVWGYLIYIIIELIKNKSSRVEEDEQKIMRLFEV